MAVFLASTLCLLVAPLAAPGRASAQAEGALTLADCLAAAYEHNLDLRIAHTERGIVQARLREATARYLPSLSLDGYYTAYNTTPTQDVTVPDNLRVRINDQTVPVSLVGALTVQTTPRDPSDMKLALSQPVFTSGKLATARAVRREEAGVASLREAQVKAEVGLAVETAFAELLLAEETLALQEDVGRRADTLLADTRRRAGAQAASRLDVLDAESAHARTEVPLVRARQNVQLRRDMLAHLMGRAPGAPLPVRGALSVTPVRADMQALVERALTDRPDLRLANQEIKVKEQELMAVKLTNTPSVSLVGAYEFAQRARNDLPENVLSGGVVLSWPILEGGTLLPRLQAARLALEEVDLRRQQLRATAELEIARAVTALEGTMAAYATQAHTLATLRERVRVTQLGLDIGSTAPIEVAQAEADLLNARLVEAQVRFDHVAGRARLGHAVGATPGEFRP